MRAPSVMVLLLVLAALLVPLRTRAEPISFELTADGDFLTVTQRGDGIAFYPRVHFLDPQGNWRTLTATPRISQLAKGDAMRFDWRPAANANPSGVLQVRYFDRAGIGFGQLGFLTQWPGLAAPFQTRSENDRLWIERVGSDVANTWVLWTTRDDERPRRFDQARPPLPPVRLQWDNSSDGASAISSRNAISLPATAGDISLLHELISIDGATSYAVQHLPASPEAPPAYRPIWLDSGKWFYAVAILFLIVAFGISMRRREAGRRP